MFPMIFISCEHNIDFKNLTGEFMDSVSLIIPLGDIDANVGGVISNYLNHNSKIVIDGEKVLYVISDSSVIDFHGLDLLTNAQEVTSTFTSTSFILPVNQTKTFEIHQSIDLGLNKNIQYERLDSIKIKHAVISFLLNEISGISPENIEFKLVFDPSQVKDIGQPIVFKPTLIGDKHYVILNNFSYYPNNQNPIPVTVQVTLKAGSNPLNITSGTRIKYTFGFEKLDYSVAYGFFAPSVLARQILRRKLHLDDFLNNSLLRFTNPKFDITGTSNVGAYIKFNFDSLKVYYDDNSAITADFDGKKWMDYSFGRKPSVPGDVIAFQMKTIDSLWGGTSRFFDKLEKPDSLEYSYGAAIDYDNFEVDDTPDFLVPDTKVKVKITATLPFNLDSGSYYQIEDSVTSISEMLANQINKIDFGNIDSTFLILKIENGLPIGCTIDLFFLDSTYHIIETDIRTSFEIESGEVDKNGTVLPGKMSKQTLKVALNKQQFEDVKKTTTMHFKFKIGGKNDSKINITTNDIIKIHVAVFLKNKSLKN